MHPGFDFALHRQRGLLSDDEFNQVSWIPGESVERKNRRGRVLKNCLVFQANYEFFIVVE